MTPARSAARPKKAAVFSTPALMVDLDIFEANLSAMEEMLAATGKKVRPHFKTHRTPELAVRQLGDKTTGATCSTVGEAEAVVAAGIADVLIANEVVDPKKLERIAKLATKTRITVAADAAEPISALAEAAARRGVKVGVLIDVDIMLHRCGVASSSEALALAEEVARKPSLELRGVMGYEGRVRLGVPDRDKRIAEAYARLGEAAEALRAAGHPVEVVSAAGTSTLREALRDPGITEIQAGVYALMEPELLVMDLPFRCAVAVRGTVISRHPDRVVADAGRRVVSMDYGPPIPVGVDSSSVALSDEHATVVTTSTPPALGSQIDFIPGQIRTTFNLHDYVWVTRGGAVVDRWPVSARGSSQ